MKKRDSEFLNHVLERLNPIGHISVRAMFGGYGIYYKAVIIGIIAYDELYFKVGADNIAMFKAAGSSPFIYAGKHKPVTMSYWRLPESVLEDDDKLSEWLEESYQISLHNKKHG